MSSSFPLDGMRVRFAGDSNVGMKRAHNEDTFYLPESERLAIVADGMGGHASGEVASRMAVETIVGFFKATTDDQQLTWPYKMDTASATTRTGWSPASSSRTSGSTSRRRRTRAATAWAPPSCRRCSSIAR